MAEINTGGGEQKKGKPKKMHLRVDFKPMVDMNMLLITFFMFCTTLSKPQMMDLVVPVKEKEKMNVEKPTVFDEEHTITLLLEENDVIYYYLGKANYEDYTSLKKTDYSPDGLRALLVNHNGKAIEKMKELRELKRLKKINDDEFDKESEDIKKANDALLVVIKPKDGSTYKNFVDVLDEMQICSIKLYAIVDIMPADTFLIRNYLEAGALTQQANQVKQASQAKK